jgi:tRNA(His) 5'-end guanylyltransferase
MDSFQNFNFDYTELCLMSISFMISCAIYYQFHFEYPSQPEQPLPLARRMKMYENRCETLGRVPPNSPFIVRLNGRNFRKIVEKRNRGVELNKDLNKAIIQTMNDVVLHFGARTGYCHNDEINLIFSSAGTGQSHIHNNRVYKINSYIAGFCSARFNYNFSTIVRESMRYTNTDINIFTCGMVYFDARVIVLPEEYEIYNNIVWRSRDCESSALRSSVKLLSGVNINGKSTNELKNILLLYKIDWNNDLPCDIKYGTFAKFEIYEENGKKLTKVVNKSGKINYSEMTVNMLLDKYWTGDNKILLK